LPTGEIVNGGLTAGALRKDFPEKSSAFTDALLMGISVQTVSNRLEESVFSVACSGLSFGRMRLFSTEMQF
jgi:hypothetical protein